MSDPDTTRRYVDRWFWSLDELAGASGLEVAQSLRAAIRDGRWTAGEALDIAAIANGLGVSPSPVREALAHLHGEGVLEARHRGGYSLPLLQLHELVAEYRFMGVVARAVASQALAPADEFPDASSSYQERLESLLTRIAGLADLPAAAQALSQCTLRISAYIRSETLFIAGADEHLDGMARALTEARTDRLPDMLDMHFQARVAAAPVIGRYVFEHSKRFGKSLD